MVPGHARQKPVMTTIYLQLPCERFVDCSTSYICLYMSGISQDLVEDLARRGSLD